MIRSVVISFMLGHDIVGYLRQRPEAGAELIDAIIAKIDDSKRIRLSRYQVKIVLGELNKDGRPQDRLWQRYSLAWGQYYIFDDDPAAITKAMDSGIKSIVKRSSQAFLDRFFVWSSTS